MSGIKDTIIKVFSNYNYPLIYVCCIALGLIIGKEKRKSIFIPAILLTIAVLNPITEIVINKSDPGGVYWRTFWIIPIIPVLAIVIVLMMDLPKKNVEKAISLVCSLGLIVLTGSNIANTTFSEANNPDKLPDNVIEVAEYLLKIDEDPYVVSDTSLSIYLRQYSGKIRSPYSRDVVYGGADTIFAKQMYNNLLPGGDLNQLALDMLNNDYEYLVTADKGREEDFACAGFVVKKQIGDYTVYCATGHRTEKREYNENHQVIVLTTIDEDGNPFDPGVGYATIKFEYLPNRLLSLTYCYDEDGDPVHFGSVYFHEYLQSLKNKNYTILIAAKDEASNGMTETVLCDLKELGIKTNLIDKIRYSFYAAILPEQVIEDVNEKKLSTSGWFGNNHTYYIESAGFLEGNSCSIMIDGEEYAVQRRGLNLVVYDNVNEKVIDTVCFDTCSFAMTERR